MTSIYLLASGPRKRLLGIKTPYAELWDRTLVGPRGSVMLTPAEDRIVALLLLCPGLIYEQMIPLIWPDPWNEPNDAGGMLKVQMSKMNRGKLCRIGLRVNLYRGSKHMEGKWLEPVPDAGRMPGTSPGPSLTINTKPP